MPGAWGTGARALCLPPGAPRPKKPGAAKKGGRGPPQKDGTFVGSPRNPVMKG